MKPIKALAAIIVLIAATIAYADNVKLTLDWKPSPAEMGGMSTNDYSTNFTFTVYQSANITTPITSWTVLTNLPATTKEVIVDAGTSSKFYAARVEGQRDASPFSSIGVWVTVSQATGSLKASKP